MNNSMHNESGKTAASRIAQKLGRKTILQKTLQVGSSTLISRVLGILREVLQVSFLGAGAVSDAFLTAYKIPNSLRKIFAEGALSAAFIPTLVKSVREKNQHETNSLMSLGFIFFEGIVLAICAICMWQAPGIVTLIAPGFSAEQTALAVPFLRILMPFIFFVSSSALLAGALQAVGHFFVPAFSPVLLNVVYIAGLFACMHFKLPVTYLCASILFGGFLQLVMHIITYWRLQFTFGPITKTALTTFGSIFVKFFLCALSMSVVEISLFIDTSFASYLPQGSISLLYYANRFMGMPLGIFAVAFSTILLPHFSRVHTYAPKRLSFYLLESTKFVFWVTIPVVLSMSFFAQKIFLTLFGGKMTPDQISEAGIILIACLSGLFFFSINKILLNLYYALHVTWLPAAIAAVGTILNVFLNWIFMSYWQATGLALATSISSGLFQTVLFVWFLCRYYNFRFYGARLFDFTWRYTVQLAAVSTLFYGLYLLTEYALRFLPLTLSRFFVSGLGFWFWAGPLCGICLLILFYTRKICKVKLYFLGDN